MKYPHTSLKIRNYKPSIVFYPDEGMSRDLLTTDEDIAEILFEVAKQLELLSLEQEIKDLERNLQMDRLLMLAREADEMTFKHIPDINLEAENFELEGTAQKALENLSKKKEMYTNLGDMSDVVLQELNRNQNIDLMASILDSIYQILISKTLILSSTLGIGDIYLDDEHKNSRLRELMARELESLGVELYVTD